MNSVVFTEETECRDCYKCVRACPVKAIRVKDNHALVESDRCIACGRCVKICPVGAQKIRNDVPRVHQLLKTKSQVFVSLAPSFPAEYKGSWRELLPKLKKLGFAGVSETAHGADLVSYTQKNILNKSDCGVVFSTACPTLVEIISLYYPQLIPNLSSLHSPLQSHAVQLHQKYGEDIGVVFIGPCIGKKLESDRTPELIDVALTFTELDELLENITLSEDELQNIPPLVPSRAGTGIIYPLDGGMIETMSNNDKGSLLESGYTNISGYEQILESLDEILKNPIEGNLFCEMLACEGGCIHGSASTSDKSLLTHRTRMTAFCREESTLIPADTQKFDTVTPSDITRSPNYPDPIEKIVYSEKEIEEAFKKLGKNEPSDILDCGGCGYHTCELFAQAWLSNQAEREMCVTSMRKEAHNKASALIQTIPMSLAIIDPSQKIIELNDRFVKFFIGEEFLESKGREHFKSLPIKNFVDVTDLATQARRGQKSIETLIRHNSFAIRTIVFPIDSEGIVGVLLQDITTPTMKREIVVKKAEEVITKSLQSVQQIASLLGENAAETEIILNSVIEAFKSGEKE